MRSIAVVALVAVAASALILVPRQALAQSTDTHRTELELLGTSGDGLLPLNVTGAISPQDLRDSVYSALRNDEQRVLRADTIADLRAVDLSKFTVEDDAVAFVSGYTAAGDHSGVFYRYDADSTDADTAGTVLAPDSGSGRWLITYPDPSKVDVRYFGVRANTAADTCTGAPDNVTALQRAADARVPLYFQSPDQSDSFWYCTSGTFNPTRGFIGDGASVSTLAAISPFTAETDINFSTKMMIDVFAVELSRQRFANIELRALPEIDAVWGSTGSGTHTAHHVVDRVVFRDAGEYQIDLNNCGAGFFTGASLTGASFFPNTGGGVMRVTTNCGNFTAQDTRISLRRPTVPPIVLNGVGDTFINTFYFGGSNQGFDSGLSAKYFFQIAGGHPYVFDTITFEYFGTVPSGEEADAIFFLEPGNAAQLIVRNLSTGGGSPGAIDGIVRDGVVGSGYKGNYSITNVANVGAGGWTFSSVLDFGNAAGRTDAIMSLDVSGVGGQTLDSIVNNNTTVASGDNPSVHVTGSLNGVTLNHHVFAGSTAGVETITHAEPLIAVNDNIDLIGANADVGRAICPRGGGTIQRIETVLDAALATGDATVTVAIAGVNVTGGVVTITQSGSAAGDVDFAVPTALNDCDEGDVITSTVGGTSTAGDGNVYLHIAPRAAV